MSVGHSITTLLSGVERGEGTAIQELFAKCYDRVASISRGRLVNANQRRFDEDDIAATAFREFLDRAARSNFNKLKNREDVWQILTLLVGDKIKDRLKYESREKRGGGKLDVTLEDVAEKFTEIDDPSLEAEIRDAKEVFLSELPSDDHRRVVELVAQGFGHKEIADELNLSLRTVDRRFEDIRRLVPQILGIESQKRQSSERRRRPPEE